jgi:hypothetical protein
MTYEEPEERKGVGWGRVETIHVVPGSTDKREYASQHEGKKELAILRRDASRQPADTLSVQTKHRKFGPM